MAEWYTTAAVLVGLAVVLSFATAVLDAGNSNWTRRYGLAATVCWFAAAIAFVVGVWS